jgi:hypothetical protein
MVNLYRFYVDCGRMGVLEGVFAENEKLIKKIIGRNVYFGEVLGKHSDVRVRMEEDHFTKLTDDQDFIKKFKEYELASGFNPFNYIEEWDESFSEENED